MEEIEIPVRGVFAHFHEVRKGVVGVVTDTPP